MKNPIEIKKFGIHIRKLRNDRGLSQQQLADMSDLSKTTIQRIELARLSATIDVLVSISKALEVPVKELVDFQDNI